MTTYANSSRRYFSTVIARVLATMRDTSAVSGDRKKRSSKQRAVIR